MHMSYNKHIVLIIFSDKCICLKTRVYGIYYMYIHVHVQVHVQVHEHCILWQVKVIYNAHACI